ncbi:MAG: ribose-phosphate pyrophosphokinase [Planctomycetes bacterium]|jgi:ribose-phosphate pyrophosphokinase|nr:ribose-phosphate pyrophosphokinase [Planctomycetota bacterium]
MRIFSGNANRPLAQAIADAVGVRLGELNCNRFPDGEVKVQIMEDVRGADVFVVQPTTTNDFLMELLVITDALRRASASRITAVVPYFGYARQDRKHEGRVPITAKLVANLMVTAGIHRVLTVDLHAQQIQGFFDVPVDHLMARPVQLEYLMSLKLTDPVVLSPDTGSIKLADRVAKALGVPLAIIDKRRTGDSQTEVANVIGEIGAREAIIIDDMITTAGSMTNAIKTARQFGAKRVIPVCTHAVLCGDAYERLSGVGLDELVITDTIPLKRRFADLPVKVLSLAPLLGAAIKNIHTNQSVSSLFVERATKKSV